MRTSEVGINWSKETPTFGATQQILSTCRLIASALELSYHLTAKHCLCWRLKENDIHQRFGKNLLKLFAKKEINEGGCEIENFYFRCFLREQAYSIQSINSSINTNMFFWNKWTGIYIYIWFKMMFFHHHHQCRFLFGSFRNWKLLLGRSL